MPTLDIRQLAEEGGTSPIAPVTVPEAVKFSDGSTLNATIGSLARIETSPVTNAYSLGDYLVWNGQLYKVTASGGISTGTSLAVGTNIQATTVADGLTPTKMTVTALSGLSILDSQCYQIGRLVVFSMRLKATDTVIVGSNYIMTGLPKAITQMPSGNGFGACSLRVGASSLSGLLTNSGNTCGVVAPSEAGTVTAETNIFMGGCYVAE